MSLGSFLKRATTPPKGVLRDIFGNSVLDEAGTVGGFLVGGPAGAAAGRGLGKLAATGSVKQGLQGAAEGYALGTGAGALGVHGGSAGSAFGKFLVGHGAGAAGSVTAPGAPMGGGGMDLATSMFRPGGTYSFTNALSSLPAAVPAAASGATRAVAGVGGAGNVIGRFLSGAKQFYAGKDGAERLQTTVDGLGTLAGIAGDRAARADARRVYDRQHGDYQDQTAYDRQREAMYDPQRQQILEEVLRRIQSMTPQPGGY